MRPFWILITAWQGQVNDSLETQDLRLEKNSELPSGHRVVFSHWQVAGIHAPAIIRCSRDLRHNSPIYRSHTATRSGKNFRDSENAPVQFLTSSLQSGLTAKQGLNG
jgi:hypothetical protein